MDFRNGRESRNVEDRRGQGGRSLGGRGKIGIGTIVLALVAMYFGIDPSVVLDTASVAQPPAGSSQPAAVRSEAENELARFSSMVLADTEDTWGPIFRASGQQYREPGLVLYTGTTRSACGVGKAQMGPFYCPADGKVYLDLSFFDDLHRSFGAPGDFAQAYVIAHEVGHHVQNLLGISGKVQQARQRASEREANQLSVRLELQADCLAGVWAHHADRARQILEQGDIEEALGAASAIGDDRIQKQAQGYAVPDSFTHGSAAQRMRWFRTGLERGDLRECDTFSAAAL
ncbi:KPN_02809 family neutral zinc metallopeptidase [Thauera linaloolentis]|uniref:Neutral zinc metallopeptidase n=1 Tax=Thauera linaloolentis (strain DSM 12138 / JCM 21573 / CCUG 41526 / CIP 105981 / IAM 15112 / NBRC 102519 / 47Lol) TaxID=1123367 RepID=N6Z8K7_THAL4|nr:neutral zinc metallopeptidase [Thauera linaloolentis]ENO90698.1 neutral zinc metallopeptidase [Thauera linaloolentis 47Lol = DSM 12138]MCM8565606.1 zinc metallopeptidase [Thauera linaloolentis]